MSWTFVLLLSATAYAFKVLGLVLVAFMAGLSEEWGGRVG